jgi:transposase-like protein
MHEATTRLILAFLACGLFYVVRKAVLLCFGCPACKRLFTRSLIRRKLLPREIEKSVSRHGIAQIFKEPYIRAWRASSEITYEVVRLDFKCESCGYTWTQIMKHAIAASVDKENRPPDEFPFT